MKNLDGKKLQLDITGFLEKQGPKFVEELWTLLLDASSQPSGIPYVFIQKKKQQLELEQTKLPGKSRFSQAVSIDIPQGDRNLSISSATKEFTQESQYGSVLKKEENRSRRGDSEDARERSRDIDRNRDGEQNAERYEQKQIDREGERRRGRSRSRSADRSSRPKPHKDHRNRSGDRSRSRERDRR